MAIRYEWDNNDTNTAAPTAPHVTDGYVFQEVPASNEINGLFKTILDRLKSLDPPGRFMPIGFDPSALVASGEWLLCDGVDASRTVHADLFAAFGTTYGPGDGATTFGIPDYRDRSLVGISGTKPLASSGGSATHVQTGIEVGPHDHPPPGLGGYNSYTMQNNAGTGGPSGGGTPRVAFTGTTGVNTPAGAPFNIQSPYGAVHWLVKT
jgi:microcystin-dependent protein